MIPSLAVVPLKRYWSGGMSVEGVAEEFSRVPARNRHFEQ